MFRIICACPSIKPMYISARTSYGIEWTEHPDEAAIFASPAAAQRFLDRFKHSGVGVYITSRTPRANGSL